MRRNFGMSAHSRGTSQRAQDHKIATATGLRHTISSCPTSSQHPLHSHCTSDSPIPILHQLQLKMVASQLFSFASAFLAVALVPLSSGFVAPSIGIKTNVQATSKASKFNMYSVYPVCMKKRLGGLTKPLIKRAKQVASHAVRR